MNIHAKDNIQDQEVPLLISVMKYHGADNKCMVLVHEIHKLIYTVYYTEEMEIVIPSHTEPS